jgi:hypothetical protein
VDHPGGADGGPDAGVAAYRQPQDPGAGRLRCRRLAWLLGLVALYAVAGGIGGVIAPGFQFSSPALLLIPHGLQANVQIQVSMHPA